jgi:leader peptidase (prepilin peptidase)/N-methyltransferase
MIAVLFGLLGLLVGGAIVHLGAALARNEPLTAPRCAYCTAERPWYQWLALPALVARSDGCRSCAAPLPIRDGLLELGLAATYAYLWIALGPSVRLPIYMAYGTVLALIVVTDLDRRRIPNVVIYPAIALAAVLSLFTPGLQAHVAWLGGLTGLAVYGMLALGGRLAYGPGAMGMGDVKLACFIGLITGFPLIVVAIVGAILCAGLVSLALLVARLKGRRDPIPYGPFLVAGAAIAALWGPTILAGFLS